MFDYDVSIRSERGSTPHLRFMVNFPPNIYGSIMLMHNEFDLPSAFSIHPAILLGAKTYYVFNIKKKHMKRVSTKNEPCQNQSFETCHEIEKYRKILDKYGCQVRFLYSGRHLDELLDKNGTFCNETITRDILGEHFDVHCALLPQCEETKYAYTVAEYKNFGNYTGIEIRYQDIEVENHISYLNYNFQTLISEIGGTLGLTLGASALTIINNISCFVNSMKHLSK